MLILTNHDSILLTQSIIIEYKLYTMSPCKLTLLYIFCDQIIDKHTLFHTSLGYNRWTCILTTVFIFISSCKTGYILKRSYLVVLLQTQFFLIKSLSIVHCISKIFIQNKWLKSLSFPSFFNKNFLICNRNLFNFIPYFCYSFLSHLSDNFFLVVLITTQKMLIAFMVIE